MKKFLLWIPTLCLVMNSNGHAMPCDISAIRVTCVSQTENYAFSSLTCGFSPDFDNASMDINNESPVVAKLRSQWYGRLFKGIEFDLSPEESEKERYVAFEWNSATGKGMVIDRRRDFNPSPWKEKTEEINCKEVDEAAERN